MTKNAKLYEQLVTSVLTEHPDTRDHDLKLYWRVASRLKSPLGKMSAEELFILWNQKRLPLIETIKRIRYRIQQHNTELRGSSYMERKTKLVRFVRKSLRYPVST